MTNNFLILACISLVILMQRVEAAKFIVGDSYGWTVPTNQNALRYNQWAEKHRFQVGDTLLFVYRTDNDALFQVTKEDYEKCNTANPLAKFRNGNTSIKLYESGTYYFISGTKENCLKNEKMIVVVMSNRGSSNGATFPTLSFIGSVGAFVGSSIFLLV